MYQLLSKVEKMVMHGKKQVIMRNQRGVILVMTLKMELNMESYIIGTPR